METQDMPLEQPTILIIADEPEFARAVHKGMIREWWLESASLPRIGADGFHANTENIPLTCEKF